MDPYISAGVTVEQYRISTCLLNCSRAGMNALNWTFAFVYIKLLTLIHVMCQNYL
jgi:hypothetical protein